MPDIFTFACCPFMTVSLISHCILNINCEIKSLPTKNTRLLAWFFIKERLYITSLFAMSIACRTGWWLGLCTVWSSLRGAVTVILMRCSQRDCWQPWSNGLADWSWMFGGSQGGLEHIVKVLGTCIPWCMWRHNIGCEGIKSQWLQWLGRWV